MYINFNYIFRCLMSARKCAAHTHPVSILVVAKYTDILLVENDC